MSDQRLQVLFRLSIVQILLAFYFIVSSLITVGLQARELQKNSQFTGDFQNQARRDSDYAPLGWLNVAKHNAERTQQSGWHMLIAGFVLLCVALGEMYVLFEMCRRQSAASTPYPAMGYDVSSGGPTHARQNAVLLAVYLAALPVVSILIYILNNQPAIHILGWSKAPGLLLLLCLLGLAGLIAFWRVPPVKVILISVCFTFPVCLPQICALLRPVADGFPLPNSIWYLLVFPPLLLGTLFVYRLSVPKLAKIGYLLVGGYIGAVHIYNGFYTNQHMNFFGNGWTA